MKVDLNDLIMQAMLYENLLYVWKWQANASINTKRKKETKAMNGHENEIKLHIKCGMILEMEEF